MRHRKAVPVMATAAGADGETETMRIMDGLRFEP